MENKYDLLTNAWDTIFNSIGDGIFVADRNNIIRKANTAFAKMLNMKLEDIIGRRCFELVHKSNKYWPGCPFEQTKLDGKTHTEEVDDSNIGIPLLVTVSPIFNKEGELVGVVHLSKDISDLKKARVELCKLAESEAMLASIVKYSDDAIIGKKLDGTIVTWNKGAEKIYGYTAEEAIGKNISLITDAERLEELKEIYKKLKMGVSVEHFETVRIKKGGEKIHVSLSVSPAKDAEGNVVGASAIARDITAKKEVEGELKKRLHQLEVFHKAAVDRELRIKELKKKVQEMEGNVKG